MAKIDESELGGIISAIKDQRYPKAVLPQRSRLVSDRRAIGKLLESHFVKAGLDVGKLGKRLARTQSEARGNFQKQMADAARRLSSEERRFHQGIERRSRALQLLSAPFTSSFVTLDKPFLIWETPHPELDIFIDSHVESLNSWVKILVNNINSGSDNTTFGFYFLWSNDSDYYAVVNVASSLVLNGACEVYAAPGFFSGDDAYLNSNATLSLMRWSGWGNDPVTGASNDQTPEPYYQQSQYQTVQNLSAHGSGLYLHQGHDSKLFAFTPYDLSYNLFAIPGHAVALFEVNLAISYSFTDGGNISDGVTVDFAANKLGYSVQCPFVQLEVLTPKVA